MNGVSYAALLRITLPQIALLLAGLLTLTLDVTVLKRAPLATRRHVGTLVGCAGCLAAILILACARQSITLPEGLLVIGSVTRVVQIALLVFAMFTVVLADAFHPSASHAPGTARAPFTTHIGEYLALLLFATVAMLFLVSTQNLLLIFIALEFLSLSLYILTGFDKDSRQSSEAALKYFLFGGMSAGFLLFGMSLLYGFSGSLNLQEIAAAIGTAEPDPLLLVAVILVIIGFGFKVAAAPFHLWAPDAYQGAPTVSAGFISSSSKVASFFIFAQVLTVGLAGVAGSHAPGWPPIICIVAALSMLLGNLAAIAQTSLRRMLAYSAIGHAGYMLVAIAAHTQQSLSALLYYVITYALASLGAFGVLSALEGGGIDRISDLAGLSRRAPGVSLCLLVFLLSLAGIPPLAGFFGKFWVFGSALNAAPQFSLLWLVLLAIAMSAVSLYYYLRVLKQVYVSDAPAAAMPIQTALLTRITLWIIAAVIVLLGCDPGLLMRWIGA